MNQCKKLLLSTAIAAALGLTATSANSAAIVSMTLSDIDGDGAISGFRFATFPATAYTPADNSFPTGLVGVGSNRFGDVTDDCGGGPGSCAPLAFGAGNVGTNVFTSGFNFDGVIPFKPIVIGSNFNTTTNLFEADGSGATSGDITAGVLDLTALDFGGLYGAGAEFMYAPQSIADFKAIGDVPVLPGDELLSVLGDPAFTGNSSTDLPYYLDTLVDNGDGTYGFIIRWTSKIAQGNSFDGNISRWRLEGTFDTNDTSVVPVPAAAWLFGSGLLGLVGVARRKKSA